MFQKYILIWNALNLLVVFFIIDRSHGLKIPRLIWRLHRASTYVELTIEITRNLMYNLQSLNQNYASIQKVLAPSWSFRLSSSHSLRKYQFPSSQLFFRMNQKWNTIAARNHNNLRTNCEENRKPLNHKHSIFIAFILFYIWLEGNYSLKDKNYAEEKKKFEQTSFSSSFGDFSAQFCQN